MKLILPPLHEKQKVIVAPRTEKFGTHVCGTKFGKTLGFSIKYASILFNSKRPIQILWGAPYYENAAVGFKYILKLLHPELRLKNSSALTITTPHNGSVVSFRGLNKDPESVEGEAFDYVIIDECSKVVPQAINSVRTTTTATRGPIDLVSTPRGKGWFFEYFKRGLDSNQKDYISNTYPTWDNPLIAREEIEIARRQMPDRLFRQYYGAEFLDDGSVFVGYHDLIYTDVLHFQNKDRQSWIIEDSLNRKVVLGVDWAKKTDYTVFTAIDYLATPKRVVGFQRFKDVSYISAVKLLFQFSKRFKDITLIRHDKTGVGETLDELLSRTSLPFEGVTFTQDRKSDLVLELILGIEKKEVEIPFWKELLEELENYEVEVSKLGKMSYSAPSGQHDDIVTSLALSWFTAVEYSTGLAMEVKDLDDLTKEDFEEDNFDSIDADFEFLTL